ncbi:MAG: cation-binding protein [Alphaproteobacteria bacterium]|nr:MAG: cation-binding protein [Alphaproteobacteria bacterium]
MSRQLQVLYDEHQSIAAVLDAFAHLLRESDRGKPVDPRVFRQILYYLDVVPERYHHPKEDQFLFASLRSRTREADGLIATLEQQHVMSVQSMRNLEQLMARWDAGGDSERAAFVGAARVFIERYIEHMRLEEEELMPLAERCLTPEDWALSEAEFARHHDPIQGAADSSELLRRILYLAPAPIGLGDPIE